MSNDPTGTAPIIAALAALVACMLSAAPVSAQIYRCESAGTTVFSDIPCSEDAEPHQVRDGISVIGAAEGLDEIAERNKAFVDQRKAALSARRERAARLAQRTEQARQRRAASEEIRYRTIIGPVADRGIGSGGPTSTDPRREAQREEAATQDGPDRRRTLLSRSGGLPRIRR